MSVSLLVGVALAVACLAYVVYPLLGPARPRAAVEARTPSNPSGGPVGGRDVTDEEIEAAVQSYRAAYFSARTCDACGPRPEPDALYCSSCGRPVSAPPPPASATRR
jgi:hypothetical protein